ncbi:MAG: hypothetical protein NXI16_02415 [Alphaproteobacteria bacterium]|nr:hypothetical protein [Alphaproteobacteria bacterium]
MKFSFYIANLSIYGQLAFEPMGRALQHMADAAGHRWRTDPRRMQLDPETINIVFDMLNEDTSRQLVETKRARPDFRFGLLTTPDRVGNPASLTPGSPFRSVMDAADFVWCLEEMPENLNAALDEEKAAPLRIAPVQPHHPIVGASRLVDDLPSTLVTTDDIDKSEIDRFRAHLERQAFVHQFARPLPIDYLWQGYLETSTVCVDFSTSRDFNVISYCNRMVMILAGLPVLAVAPAGSEPVDYLGSPCLAWEEVPERVAWLRQEERWREAGARRRDTLLSGRDPAREFEAACAIPPLRRLLDGAR